jgi:hypothetical protein
MRGKIEKKKKQSKEKRNEGGKHNGPNGVKNIYFYDMHEDACQNNKENLMGE